MFTDPVSGQKVNSLKEVGWKHDHVIDFMIANPRAKQGEIARMFDRSEGWVSIIINSDAFQARLAERKAELVDPLIREGVDARLKAVAAQALDKMLEKLTSPVGVSDEFALKSAELSVKALGYGARPSGGQGAQTNVAVVVNMPTKQTEAEWRAKYSPSPEGVSDAVPAPEGLPAPDEK